ncbi:nuclear transport factor 2 family protein [Mucilaginibacter sp. UR6-1]|uniref:nuclear transport factor 2 family protein n=1 Tax=Mucilaginibacter sp. UR6-1 TaxID=1435643 RepID=UPI001E3E4FAB|nr:nuclear transport factor 2 family protein [Mucilaginibacter sp. UR6-1]MCC8409988.1 nuclear transport factor 2 family protein [Mucilaginibacter sp. UR6-1]
MKLKYGILVVLISWLSISIASAQTPAQKQVAAAVDTLYKAMVDADKDKLDKLTAPQLSFGHSSGKVEDKAAFINALTSGASDFTSITAGNQTITIVKDVAIVRHVLNGEILDGGKPGNVKLGILLVWKKQQKQWVLLARQAYKLP